MNKSETIGALALALSKLQGEAQNLHKDKQGYGYKYAELSSVLDEVRPLLAKFELAVTQLCSTENTNVIVETVLLHSTGEWLSSSLSLPISVGKGMSQAQAIGSCISYGRRYALAAMIGIAQADNDASLKEEEPAAVATPATPPTNKQEQIATSLQNKLETHAQVLAKLGTLVESNNMQDKIPGWLEHFKVAELGGLSTADLKKLIKKIEEASNGN